MYIYTIIYHYHIIISSYTIYHIPLYHYIPYTIFHIFISSLYTIYHYISSSSDTLGVDLPSPPAAPAAPAPEFFSKRSPKARLIANSPQWNQRHGKTHGKTRGKPMENPWNPWKNHGKSMENPWVFGVFPCKSCMNQPFFWGGWHFHWEMSDKFLSQNGSIRSYTTTVWTDCIEKKRPWNPIEVRWYPMISS